MKPTSAQLVAMSTYFLGHFASGYGGTTRHTGCITYSMGTHSESGGRMIAYTQLVCVSCPMTTGTGETVPFEERTTPVVFRLRGSAVTSAQADTESGNPMFGNVITEIFPASLRTSAADQVPHVTALMQIAAARGGC